LTGSVDVDLDAVLDSIGEVATRLGVALTVEDLTGDDAGDEFATPRRRPPGGR
jgi:hypothetical protein